MKYKLLFFLTLYITWVAAEDTKNPCEPAETCKNCLNANGECYWCVDDDYTSKDQRKPRCNKLSVFRSKEGKCKKIQIEDGSVASTKSVKFGAKVQVRPQVVTLKLRPGQTRAFTLSVKPAEDYPVSLYYLMDMSNSMKDDLDNLKTLGTKIAKELKNITKNYKLAFGTFVDKTVTPFIQLESKNHPCKPEDVCEPTFGYRHVFDFNKDAKKFEAAVSQQKISGNLDTPEGGFDALMQVAVCGDKIWKEKLGFSRRIVVFVTDATPHIAGDGKIGGITVPNDGACHLRSGGTSKLMYSKTNNLDYPSISLLKAKMKENKVVPIIAVTSDVKPIYERLQEEWKDLGTGLGSLERDSSNIVNLIRDNYKKISTTVRLSSNAPSNLVVKYRVTDGCPTSKKDNECTGVAINQEVSFRVQVTATNCPDNWEKGQKWTINVPGFGDVQVNTEFICNCDCEKTGVGKSQKCNGTGTYQCGICKCGKERFGKKCECDSESQADTSLCVMPNATDKAICSGFGSCVCGKCECNVREDATKIISGTYCQCNNFGCDRFGGKICGGEERGICKCGRCVCKEAFQGENCGQVNCTLAKKNCIKNGLICSGNGRCDCDQCSCNTGYKGAYCENCVSCSGKCKNNEDCVLCQDPYKIGEKELCDKCKMNIVLVNETQKQCSVKLNETCRVYFSFRQDSIGNETVLVEREPRCIIVLTREPPILIIVLGIIGGIVLVGLLILFAWKLIVTAYDNHEYHTFEKDRMKSKWENAENPIYRPSKQQFQNPAYAGNK